MEICPGAAILGLSGPPKSGRYSKAKTGAQCAAWKTKAGARVIRVERSMVFQKKKKKVGGLTALFSPTAIRTLEEEELRMTPGP